ncbi:MAG: hypothetical protein IH984_10025 [Planctomycetes bacterium]|nr:hypothetical protein [Planctomycetota bacterium]
MTRQYPTLTIKLLSIIILGLTIVTAPADAQNGRPSPLPANGPSPIQDDDIEQPLSKDNGSNRRLGDPTKIMVNLNDVSVEETLKLIVEVTGKVVIPIDLNTTLRTKKITLMVDRLLDQSQALDLLFQAFRLNEIGVIEKEDRIIIALLSEILQFEPPVIGADVDIMDDTNLGTIITKFYRLKYADAATVSESIDEIKPDWATLTVDASSNQIIVQGDIGLCQRIQLIVNQLDQVFKKPKMQTFTLAFADANEVMQHIYDLFEETNTSSSRSGSRNQSSSRRSSSQAGRRNQALPRSSIKGGTESLGGQPLELRVTVDVQQNSVTVVGEPTIVDQVAVLISTQWDLPRAEGTAKVYTLKYTDPVKIRDMLQDLLGEGGGSGRGLGQGRGRAGGAAGPSQVGDLVSGIYQIQAYPDSNSLLVICKTEENFKFLDSIIEQLDQPVIPQLPLVVALKHADAEEVADEVNVLLAPAGTRADIRRKDSGLIGFDISGPTDGGGAAESGREGETGTNITFPWQQTRQTEDETPPSPLIGKVRVVPIHRQNAVMILAPLEYRDAVRDFIVDVLDSPGRQVMISAIIAEIELKDEFAFGLRLSNSDSILSGTLVDNRIGGTFGFTGQEDPLFDNLFDTSVLDVNISLTAVIQALDQKTNIRILQEPRIFTSDNQEASFFEGQDVPILETAQTTPQGVINETIVYRQVGVGLNVRPRITEEGEIDLELNLVISNIVPGATLFNSPIFDRRETTTQIIVKNGQTIVLSGIMKELESKVTRGLPLLGDIPIIGALFQSHETTTIRRELIAFITPIIVANPSDNDDNFNRQDLERLNDLMLPLDEQKRNLRLHSDDLRSRLLNKHYTEPDSGSEADVNNLNDNDG